MVSLVSSTWGNNIKISIFGESHGKAIGVVVDGLPAGEKIDFEEILLQMSRRSPGKNDLESKREEKDYPEILSGLKNFTTTGSPLSAIIANENFRHSDYDEELLLIRPGHADYTVHMRYNGFEDHLGGGHLSGRLTAPLVFAGSVCKQILEKRGILIASHISSIRNIKDSNFDPVDISCSLLKRLSIETFPTIDASIKKKMESEILKAKSNLDSVGGAVECAIVGLPAGVGNPIFDNIESKISSIIFGIPGIKAIEFGSGFTSSTMLGSENNDSFILEDSCVKTVSNNHGGILGGISSGMPIIFKVGFKPTPSIAKKQLTVDLSKHTQTEISIKGRHDPCIVSRAAVVVEAAAAIAILDLIS